MVPILRNFLVKSQLVFFVIFQNLKLFVVKMEVQDVIKDNSRVRVNGGKWMRMANVLQLKKQTPNRRSLFNKKKGRLLLLSGARWR